MLSFQNKTIVLTRSKNQISNSSSLFKEYGFSIIEFPVIEITEPDDWAEFDNLIPSKKFDLIVFTSVNAAKYLYNRLKTINYEFNFNDTLIVSVGSKTAEVCKELFSKVDIIPKDYSAKGILETLNQFDLSNKNILIPQSEIAKKDLADELRKRQANVLQVTVYKNVLPNRNELKDIIELIKTTNVDAFIFTSPSTFRNFLTLMEIDNAKDFFGEKVLAAIGDTTKNEIEKYGLKNIIKPDLSTLENIAIKLSEYFNSIGEKIDKT
jgi:uroporphyrinogen-III synthase